MMRNTLISFMLMLFAYGSIPPDEHQEFLYQTVKKGCLDEYAVNYCYDCSEEGGMCLYDSQYSKRCEDPYVKWKTKYTPIKEFTDKFSVFTLSDCWQEWEVVIYDFSGNEIWRSYEPNEEWSVQMNGEYVEAGEYFMSIKCTTIGETKTLDILTEFEIYYN